MKKLIALLLCIVMVLSVLAGCGPTAPSSGDNGDKDSANNGTLPDDVVLKIGIPRSGMVEDYDTNAYTLWLEEQTGYDLQFQIYEGGANDYMSQLSVAVIDEEELPDILMGFNLGKGVYEDYGEDGIFIDMRPYFEDKDKSGSWWESFEQVGDKEWQDYVWERMVAGEDGGIYAFPHLEESSYDPMRHQAFINQDWLDKLGLPMPTDTESFYNTLVAFKTQDPNGNGKADEVPLIGVAGGYGDTINWLINMFVYHNPNRFWRVDEQGELYHIYASNEYREALKYINKLVKEGLMPTSVWSMNDNDVKNQLAPGDNVQKVGVFCGHPTLALAINNENIYSYKALPYWGYATLNDLTAKLNTFITEDCEYPDAAWNLLMLMSSKEGSYRQRYGEKGVDWVDADEGAVSFLGQPAELKVINEGAYTDMGNQTWSTIVSAIVFNAENEACQISDDMSDWVKHKMGMMAECHENYYEAVKRNPTNIVGLFDYTTEDEDFIMASKSNTVNFINQCRASFCTGSGNDYTNPSNDAQWEAYVKGIEAQDIATWKSVDQELYELHYGGK